MFGEKIMPELHDLFIQELEQLIDKYTRIDEGEIRSVRNIIEIFRRVDVTSKKAQRLENILEKTKLLKDHPIEEIELQVWIQDEMNKKVEIEEVKNYLSNLSQKGAARIENTIIYLNRRSMEVLLKEVLDEMLQDTYHVERLFDKEQLVEMWLEGTEKEDAIKDLIDGCMPEDLLETVEQEAYTSVNGDTIMYMNIDI